MSTSKLILAALAGAAAGVIAGILIAPESGKKTREKLKKKVDDFSNLDDLDL